MIISTAPRSPDVRFRHGRRFHDTGSNYGLPNDEEEHMRLNYQHEALKIMLGSNYTAPLPKLNAGTGPKNILDVGSGSGQWVVEIAQEFPNAKVVGIDISEPGLSPSSVPQNASFMIGDITMPFPFENSSFDVVQMRVVPSIQERTEIYKEIHRVLQPGGLIVLVEPAEHESRLGVKPPSMIESTKAMVKVGHIQASRKSSQNKSDSESQSWSIATRIANDLRASPSMWANVHERKLVVPIGVWTDDEPGRKAGKLLQYCAIEILRGFRPAIIDAGVLSGDRLDEIIGRVAQELEDGDRWQLQSPYYFVWAEKSNKQ